MPDQNGDFTTAVSHSAVDKVQVVDVDMVLQMKDGTSVVLAGGAISAMDASRTTIKFNDGPQDTLSHLLDQVGVIAVPQLDQVLSSLQAPPGSTGQGAGSYSPSAAADTGMSASVTSQIVNQLTQIVETNAQSATIQTVDPTAQVAVLSQNTNTGKIDSQPLQQVQPPSLPERPGVIPQEHVVGPDAPNMTLSLVNLTTVTQVGSAAAHPGKQYGRKYPEHAGVDVRKLSFERAIEELESIVKRLEDGKVPLEELVAIYERGESLKRRCEELLRQAEARVDKITTDASGQPTGTEPLDVQ